MEEVDIEPIITEENRVVVSHRAVVDTPTNTVRTLAPAERRAHVHGIDIVIGGNYSHSIVPGGLCVRS